MMKKLALAIALVSAVGLAAGTAYAQRGGGGGGGGGAGMRGGGGGSSGGGWQGGGGGNHGGGGWQGGSSGWHGGGSGWHGGGYYGGGYRGGYYGYRGGYYGGWYGPGLGIYVGGPYWGWGAWPYAYPYPVYSSYPVASYPAYADVGASGTYIQATPDPAASQANYWYYCTDPAGYYPYVQNCSKNWLQVVPQNVPGSPGAPAPQ